MISRRVSFLPRSWPLLLIGLALGLPALADAPSKTAPLPLATVLDKAIPESVGDLRAIQRQVKKVLEKVMPCTVAVKVGNGQGSGVIVRPDGYVLTAGHVVGKAERDAIIILPGGKVLHGKTLGANRSMDSGLIKITDEGNWPFVDLGSSKDIKRGQWCITLGHPGGFKPGRSPVVRVGRVLDQSDNFVRTSCTLVGGDSGGPLFDLDGKVIGIHSRIGNLITANLHVPVDTYRENWEKLAKGETWGGRNNGKEVVQPFLGVQGDSESRECRLLRIIAGSPAEKAGLLPNDVVVRFDNQPIGDYETLVALIANCRPGQPIMLEVQRGEELVSIRAVLGKREAGD
jgi:serine protease Do